jgi:hypothetical protein
MIKYLNVYLWMLNSENTIKTTTIIFELLISHTQQL